MTLQLLWRYFDESEMQVDKEIMALDQRIVNYANLSKDVANSETTDAMQVYYIVTFSIVTFFTTGLMITMKMTTFIYCYQISTSVKVLNEIKKILQILVLLVKVVKLFITPTIG